VSYAYDCYEHIKIDKQFTILNLIIGQLTQNNIQKLNKHLLTKLNRLFGIACTFKYLLFTNDFVNNQCYYYNNF